MTDVTITLSAPLAAGTYSLTLAAVAPPAPPPPPAATTFWVYQDGEFNWGGDWSSGALANYSDKAGAPLSGPFDIAMTASNGFGLWTPFAPLNSAGIPAFDASPYTHFTVSLKPTRPGQKWSLYLVPGPAGETFVNGTVVNDISAYGPAPVVGAWGTYVIPLSVLGVGAGLAVGTDIRKIGLQDQSGSAGNFWYIDNVGFM